ncbi:hypothetical protein C7974DRAFT_193097 [Boeremia exigua]|uniref:uncharacterized protein n=1 Tax=Boeremia exigua TaxID=749465 RepID=UPI001E8CE9F8|nr:uncharacterized protein C7974DRAFT_193097 [Boeremia exigua]KAH6629794.1 hypothetical protein C7974DRAFT_193097 [Boeremia exigua]
MSIRQDIRIPATRIVAMADPISLASGVLTLVIFAHKSCLALHTTIQSFKNHPKRVRDLTEELAALIDVLESLDNTLRSHTDVDLPALDLPLQRCGSACNEFLEELQRCSSRSGGDRRSFRDWAKLRYMGDNIDDFKDSLAAYKSTLNIALTDLQLRTSSVTLERLEEYKDLIKTATNDLEARLETIDEKLQSLVDRTTPCSTSAELQSIKDERSSTQKCLIICAQFSKLIEELQLSSAEDVPKGPDNVPEKITSDGIEECRISMAQTAARLESHMQETLDRMLSNSSTAMTPEDLTYLARLREEWATARKCRDICALANQNLKENISVIDNHATGDKAVQFLVSNSQKTIHGKNRGYGNHIKQLGGHLSDQSIQKVSGDFLQMIVQSPGDRHSSTRVDAPPNDNGPNDGATTWRPQYGNGKILRSCLLPDPLANDFILHRAGSDQSRDR